MIGEFERQHRRWGRTGKQRRSHSPLSRSLGGRIADDEAIAQLGRDGDRRIDRPADADAIAQVEEAGDNHGVGREALFFGVAGRRDVAADGSHRTALDQDRAIGNRLAGAGEHTAGANDFPGAGLFHFKRRLAIDIDALHARPQGERIAIQYDEVGIFAGGQRADAIRDAEQAGGVGRQHPHHFGGRRAVREQPADIQHVLEIGVVGRLHGDADAGSAQVAGRLGDRAARAVIRRRTGSKAGTQDHAGDVRFHDSSFSCGTCGSTRTIRRSNSRASVSAACTSAADGAVMRIGVRAVPEAATARKILVRSVRRFAGGSQRGPHAGHRPAEARRHLRLGRFQRPIDRHGADWRFIDLRRILEPVAEHDPQAFRLPQRSPRQIVAEQLHYRALAWQQTPAAGRELHRRHAAGEGGGVIGIRIEAVDCPVMRRECVQIVAALFGQRRLGDDQAGDDDGVAEVVRHGVGWDGRRGSRAGRDDLAVAHDEHRVGDRRAVARPEPRRPDRRAFRLPRAAGRREPRPDLE